MRIRQTLRGGTLLSMGVLAAFLFAACAQAGGAQGQPGAQTGAGSGQALAAKDREVADLKAQLAGLQQDGTYWKEITALMMPVEMPSMKDHRAYMLPTGGILALHFDSMDLKQAKHLNWVALGVPGKFTREEQQRVEAQFGKGFTHFHDMKNDVHGGQPGAEGAWFVHVAVREFDAPWGRVKPGIDDKFMPTPPVS